MESYENAYNDQSIRYLSLPYDRSFDGHPMYQYITARLMKTKRRPEQQKQQQQQQ